MWKWDVRWVRLGLSGALIALGAGCHHDETATTDCSAATAHVDQVVCASNAFLATLTDAQRSAVVYEWTDEAAKTRWSNLPGVTRNGLSWGTLSDTSKAAALHLASLVLTDEGYADMTGIFAADDYLNSLGGASGGGGGGGSPDGGGGGPPGGGGGGPPDGGSGGPSGGGGGGTGFSLTYGSANYIIAFIGTPSATGSWMLQIGGHHMAYNITYINGVASATPNHLGAEPKAAFTSDAGTFAPLQDDGAELVAVFKALDSTQLNNAYLTGQTFSDVVLGPVEYGTGSYAKVVYPTQAGIKVSGLSTAQQALVIAAIKKWVNDFVPAIADPLLAAYTTSDALAQTTIAWGGTQSQGVNVDVNGTYMRIDGPRLWLEVDCQAGVVIQGTTHYHTIYRDKLTDYGDELKQ